MFRAADFLGFTEYIAVWKEADKAAFFSYVCLVRGRQMLVFFLCLFLFSPYIVFCLLDFCVSIFSGFFVSLLVVRYGWTGMGRGLCFFVPHYIFYGMFLSILYIYLFRRGPMTGRYFVSPGISLRQGSFFDNKVMVSVLCILLFGVGCYAEAYLNPVILKNFFH